MDSNRNLTPQESKHLDEFIVELDKHIGVRGGHKKLDFLQQESARLTFLLKKNPPDENTMGVLFSEGTPFERAQILLSEIEGPKAEKAPSNWAKWLAITILGMFGLACVTTLILVAFFSPFIDVSPSGKVKLLGGAITIDDSNFQVYHNGKSVTIEQKISGSTTIPDTVNKVDVEFENGQIELFNNGKSGEVSWDCELVVAENSGSTQFRPFESVKGSELRLEFNEASGLLCQITVPSTLKSIAIEGENGQIFVSDAKSPLDLELENGVIEVTPNTEDHYNWDLKVKDGVISGAGGLGKNAKTKGKIRVESGQIKITPTAAK